MIAGDLPTTRWLRAWVDAGGERSLLLCLPGGWFELSAATIAAAPDGDDYVVRFDRRTEDRDPR